MNEGTGGDNVIPLGTDPPKEVPAPVASTSRLHAVATAGMAICALIGVLATYLFITVNWTETTRRYVIVAGFLAGIGFLAFASTAIAAAARDTYTATRKRRDDA